MPGVEINIITFVTSKFEEFLLKNGQQGYGWTQIWITNCGSNNTGMPGYEIISCMLFNFILFKRLKICIHIYFQYNKFYGGSHFCQSFGLIWGNLARGQMGKKLPIQLQIASKSLKFTQVLIFFWTLKVIKGLKA